MGSYHVWDETIPAIPPRSRLYCMEPIGVRTPSVECLTSYIARLAEEHGVTLKSLMMHVIFPALGQDVTEADYYRRLSTFCEQNCSSLNGRSPMARQWVAVMQNLTSCESLRFLTMLTWSEVTAIRKLVRQRKAWCPACYDDWRQARQVLYDPLLWALKSVQMCPHHRRPLVTVCPHCQVTLPFLSPDAHPGYCTRCAGWLGGASAGEEATSTSIDRDYFDRQYWIAQRVGEMLAAAPDLIRAPSKEQIAYVLGLCVDHYMQGNISVLAQKMNVSPSCLWKYLRKGDIPFFDFLLHLSYTLSIPPLEFLTASSLPRRAFLPMPIRVLPEVSRGRTNRITQDDIRHMWHALETQLAGEEVVRYPSQKEIAEWIGCSVYTLRRHCPDLCRASARRYKRKWVDDSVRLQMREALENALAASDPVSLMAVAQRVGCQPATMRKYFPELCQAVVARYRGRFDGQRVQQRLQEVLASDEDVPSMSELAGQLGYSVTLIWHHFTDLCKRISARYRDKKRKRHEEQMKTVCEEIRQAVLLLHKQGIYPSAKRVSFLLKNRHSVRTFEGHEAWRLALAELGYPTDAIKRYG
jgi:hypothetical protein